MLQSLSIRPLLPVLGGNPCSHSRAEPVADVLTTPDRGVNAIVNVYFRSTTNQSMQERTPDYSFRCTFAELKTMRSQIQLLVGRGAHCAQCKRVAAYMTYCWERPRLLAPSWQGGMNLQMEPLATFLNQLLYFAAQLGVEEHPEFAAIMARFMQLRGED